MAQPVGFLASELVKFPEMQEWLRDQGRTNVLSSMETTIVVLFREAITENLGQDFEKYAFRKWTCLTTPSELSPISEYTFSKESESISTHMGGLGRDSSFALLLRSEVVTDQNKKIQGAFYSCVTRSAIEETGGELPKILMGIFKGNL